MNVQVKEVRTTVHDLCRSCISLLASSPKAITITRLHPKAASEGITPLSNQSASATRNMDSLQHISVSFSIFIFTALINLQ